MCDTSRTMKSLLVVVAALLLVLGVTACADSKGGETRARDAGAIAPNFSTHNNDRDNDGDHNDDDAVVLGYGHAAGPSDQRMSVALVTRYFALAAAADGARACSLLEPIFAESVAENDGQSPQLRGGTCAVVLSKLFKLHHRELAEKSARLRVTAVRVSGEHALAVLFFPQIPEVRQFIEHRVGRTWRLAGLLDGNIE